MAVSEVTIRMPKESLAKWLAALRSGEYKQGKGSLKSHEGYCCLGVLQCALDGDVEYERYTIPMAKTPLELPTLKWLSARNIKFHAGPRNEQSHRQPYLPSWGTTTSVANDYEGASFLDIADAIELCAEGT